MEVSIPDNLEELKRNKLQSLCKTFKIPANLKVSLFIVIHMNSETF